MLFALLRLCCPRKSMRAGLAPGASGVKTRTGVLLVFTVLAFTARSRKKGMDFSGLGDRKTAIRSRSAAVPSFGQ